MSTITVEDGVDSIPPVSDIEFPCVVCGQEAGPYSGRGRRPSRCAEHKQGAKTKTVPADGGEKLVGNEKLAAQAADMLCQIDGMLAFGAQIVGLTDTANTIMEADEAFKQRVTAALVNSPKTARKIMQMGSKAGDTALLVAILLHIGTIAPVFYGEVKTKRAEKLAAQAEADEGLLESGV
jgi:hypothetical protein